MNSRNKKTLSFCLSEWMAVVVLMNWLVMGRRPLYRGRSPIQLISSISFSSALVFTYVGAPAKRAPPLNQLSLLNKIDWFLLLIQQKEWWSWWLNWVGADWKPITFYPVIKNLWFLWRERTNHSINHHFIPFPFHEVSWWIVE